MLDQVLEVFGITPEYDLNIMAPNQDLYDITAKVLLGLREVLKDFRPDTVLVHGDTTTIDRHQQGIDHRISGNKDFLRVYILLQQICP